MSLLSAAPLCRWAHFATHCCVGVVRSPCRGLILGEPLWTCRLLISDCGLSASSSPGQKVICSQELLTLKCRGVPFVEYCASELKEGALVHVVAKMYQKPRFVPIHGTYVEDTELLVSEEFGSLVLLKQL
ncbi:uncharacterized protein TM35_000341140 [Trypanosoma theileri]|uniref:Uncharacterized protein n=1 Tax=Trypanosoma theileri TaxID=67003 RepID=A0A1X0NL52_9TRYP|nr:uncharacterized protein TM35_000341140 [Trypanosoma theileri]ORC85502.1 hypothetical protein TM35_000341140 [Trypanosoma theileri]